MGELQALKADLAVYETHVRAGVPQAELEVEESSIHRQLSLLTDSLGSDNVPLREMKNRFNTDVEAKVYVQAGKGEGRPFLSAMRTLIPRFTDEKELLTHLLRDDVPIHELATLEAESGEVIQFVKVSEHLIAESFESLDKANSFLVNQEPGAVVAGKREDGDYSLRMQTGKVITSVRESEDAARDAVDGKAAGEWRPYLDNDDNLRACFSNGPGNGARTGDIPPLQPARALGALPAKAQRLGVGNMVHISRESAINWAAPDGPEARVFMDKESPGEYGGLYFYRGNDGHMTHIDVRPLPGENNEQLQRRVEVPLCDNVASLVNANAQDGLISENNIVPGKLIAHQKTDGELRMSFLYFEEKEDGTTALRCLRTAMDGNATQEQLLHTFRGALDVPVNRSNHPNLSPEDILGFANIEEMQQIFGDEYWETGG